MAESIIIAHTWITGRDCIGVIITFDENKPGDHYKALIGCVPIDQQDSEEQSMDYIHKIGAKFDLPAAIALTDNSGQWHQPDKYLDIYRYAIHSRRKELSEANSK